MRKILTLSLYLMATVAFFSCSVAEPTPATPIDMLTGGSSKSWLLTNVKADGVKDFEDCDSDNAVTFTKATSKALLEVGAKKCSSSDANETNDFKLSSDGKKLTFSGFEFTVVKLTATELELKATMFGGTYEQFMKAK